jgi:hypothetical protein
MVGQAREREQVVVGRAPDLAYARQVCRQLQEHGVDAADLRLAATTETDEEHILDDVAREHLAEVDATQAGPLARTGAAVGAIAGAAVGAFGGFLAASGDVGDNVMLFAVVVLVFAALGAWVAATMSATRALLGADAPRHAPEPSTWLAVRVRGDRDARHTRDLLRRQGIRVVEEQTARTLGARAVRW